MFTPVLSGSCRSCLCSGSQATKPNQLSCCQCSCPLWSLGGQLWLPRLDLERRLRRPSLTGSPLHPWYLWSERCWNRDRPCWEWRYRLQRGRSFQLWTEILFPGIICSGHLSLKLSAGADWARRVMTRGWCVRGLVCWGTALLPSCLRGAGWGRTCWRGSRTRGRRRWVVLSGCPGTVFFIRSCPWLRKWACWGRVWGVC